MIKNDKFSALSLSQKLKSLKEVIKAIDYSRSRGYLTTTNLTYENIYPLVTLLLPSFISNLKIPPDLIQLLSLVETKLWNRKSDFLILSF
jgi:hypothetical protein